MKTGTCNELGCTSSPDLVFKHQIIRTKKYFCDEHDPRKNGRYTAWTVELLSEIRRGEE